MSPPQFMHSREGMPRVSITLQSPQRIRIDVVVEIFNHRVHSMTGNQIHRWPLRNLLHLRQVVLQWATLERRQLAKRAMLRWCPHLATTFAYSQSVQSTSGMLYPPQLPFSTMSV